LYEKSIQAVMTNASISHYCDGFILQLYGEMNPALMMAVRDRGIISTKKQVSFLAK
jgi:hypothetical protein